MALEIYADDAMTLPIKQIEKFDTVGETDFTLTSLLGIDITSVFKWDGIEYLQLTDGVDFSIQSNTIVLTTALVADEHIVAFPTDHMNLVFTGPETAIRTQTKKLVLHKTGAYIYDGLMMYSEDLLTEPTYFMDLMIGTGYVTVGIDGSFNIYDGSGILITNGVGIAGFTAALNENAYIGCGVLINDYYIGDCIGNGTSHIVLAPGTTIPAPTYIQDKVELLSTGNLTFALDSNGTIPADNAFKKFLSIPSLTTAEPTQKLWLRENAIIPGWTQITPNMPFKLMGQEYPE